MALAQVVWQVSLIILSRGSVMRVLFLDTFSGISGNMLLGLLIDLGADQQYILSELNKLNIGEYKIIIERVNKLGIDSTYVDVQCKEFDEQHSHEHGLVGTLIHKLQNILGKPTTGHVHSHGGVTHSHGPEAQRNLDSIMEIINNSELAATIKFQAEKVFTELAKAEAKVHGKSIQEVHFHEVGAVDTIIDIVGCLLALENLKVEKIMANRLQTGRGFVKCAHGLMPIPAPATAELIKNIPNYAGEIDKELVTPTGAALLKVLVTEYQPDVASLEWERIGYGAGTWDLSIPNVVRGYLGEKSMLQESALPTVGDLLVIQTNIDDMNPEYYEYILNKLLENGCQDVWLTAIIMKKNRPANVLNILCQQNLFDKIVAIVLRETTSIGLRYYPVQRVVAEREIQAVVLKSGSVVAVKCAYFQGELINRAPEYESCLEVAKRESRPLKDIYQEALECLK